MSVAFDASGSNVGTDSGVSATTFSNTAAQPTVGASATALIAMFAWSNTPSSITSANWNGVAMTAIGALQSMPTATNGSCQLFGILNPASGQKQLDVTWVGSSQVSMCAMSVTGSTTSSFAACFKNATGTNGTSTTPSQVITSASGDMAVSVMCTVGTLNSFNTGGANTNIYLDANATNDNAGQRGAGASSVTCSGAIAASSQWAIAGVDIAAAAAGDTLQSQSVM